MMTNLVEQISIGTNSHTECLEIGSGVATSYSSINDQAEFACEKIKLHPIFSK
jgi:hypothetical protein